MVSDIAKTITVEHEIRVCQDDPKLCSGACEYRSTIDNLADWCDLFGCPLMRNQDTIQLMRDADCIAADEVANSDDDDDTADDLYAALPIFQGKYCCITCSYWKLDYAQGEPSGRCSKYQEHLSTADGRSVRTLGCLEDYGGYEQH